MATLQMKGTAMSDEPLVSLPKDETTQSVSEQPLNTQIRFEDIFGQYETITSVPTDIPKNAKSQIRVYVNGSDIRLYVYDISNNTWRYSALGFTLPLDITNGGTGQTTATAAFNALSPLTTKGDLLGFNTTNARYAVGADGTQLRADSAQTNGIFWEQPFQIISTDFEASGRFTFNQAGGASATYGGADGVNILTPGVAAYGQLLWKLGGSTSFTAYARPTQFGCSLYLNQLGTSCQAYVGIGNVTTSSGAGGHTFTNKHVGFKIINSGGTITLYGTVANGTTESTVSISTISAPVNLDLVCFITNAGTVNFWARNDGGAYSVASITTNVPAANSTENQCQFSVSTVNTTNTAQILLYGASHQR